MRFTTGNSCSSGTVGLILISFTRFRRSIRLISLGLMNPLGIDVCLRKSRITLGSSAVAAGVSASVVSFGAFVVLRLDFVGAFFF